MTEFRYQIGLMGRPNFDVDELVGLIRARSTDLGLENASLVIYGEAELVNRDRKAPFVGVFFGYDGANSADHPMLHDIHRDSLVIIPVVDSLDGFRVKIPVILEAVNGLEIGVSGGLERLVSTIFENLRLLRSDRRLFISYRRAESTPVAAQLYEEFDARGFDVFLDTRSVRPATNFQSELWHRLSDSDLVVLLETPNFRDSAWTVAELTQANSTNVQILHLLWPEVDPDPTSAFSEFVPLALTSFNSGSADLTAKLTDQCLKEIYRKAESLRARALAARYTYIVDSFCDSANAYGIDVAVHPERYLSLEIAGMAHAIFPAIGVPRADGLEAFERALDAKSPRPTARVVYDERGVLDNWNSHLSWLSEHLPIKAIQLSHVDERFKMGNI